MHQRTLGDTAFITSAIGLGCMGFSQGYGPADDAESIAAIRAALDTGMTMLDTAMTYGQGHNERLLARALAERSDADEVQIATKFGILRNDSGVRLDGRPERVREFCEASLARLDREVVDLYYLHRVDPDVPIEESIGAMVELVEEGKVRHLGVSEVTPGQLAAAVAVHPILAVQFEWSLLWREPERDLVHAARSLGVGLVPYSPLGRGLLTDTLYRAGLEESDFRRSDPRFQGENLTRNLSQVSALRSVAAELGFTSGQLALAWLLAQGDDVVPIPGTRRPERIAENAAAADIQLSSGDLERIDAAAPPEDWAGDRRSFGVPATIRSGL
jgi:aryl-alcohol dehydrogenase-like predicted oxidoreductase